MSKQNLPALFLLLAATAFAKADSTTLSLDSVFNPSVAGTSPYVVADFSSTHPGTVNLTLTSPGLVTNPAESLMSLFLNTNPALGDPANHLVIKSTDSTGDLMGTSIGEDANKADGDGKYDVMLTFKSGTVSHTSTNTFSIVGSGAFASISAGTFSFIGSPGSGSNTGPFYAAAHVQNTTTSGGGGWIGATVPAPVPAATTAMLFGVIVLGRMRVRGA